MNDYCYNINGHIERNRNGKFTGAISIYGIDLSPIEATFFKDDDGDTYLWLKRSPVMEYDFETMSYKKRPRRPSFEAYMKKQMEDDVVAFKGQFMFMRFKFSIVGVWDTVIGKDKSRMNLFVERLPMSQQTILNDINERKRKEKTC